ncbi:uncharacterized protein LOC142768843 isoform X8 [Rhipicephalus microplus]|uniref:uncharacterized protein LOC142768843 isoform X8 n=1 Tax=Rhipicephalus microplus TaxID=6941 RepID=UPI003F6B220B
MGRAVVAVMFHHFFFLYVWTPLGRMKLRTRNPRHPELIEDHCELCLRHRIASTWLVNWPRLHAQATLWATHSGDLLGAIFTTLPQLCEEMAISAPWTEKLGTIVKEVHSRRSVRDRRNSHHCGLRLSISPMDATYKPA